MDALGRPLRPTHGVRRSGAAALQSSPVLRWLVLVVFVDGLLNALYARALVAWPTLSWTVDVVTHGAVPLGLLGLALWRRQVTLADLGFRSQTNDEHGRIVLAVLLVSVPVASIIVYALAVELGDSLVPGSRVLVKVPSSGVIPTPGPWRWLAILYLGASAAVVTELVYRAVLKLVLPPRLAVAWLYAALSGLLFGLTFWESGPSMIITTALFGLFLAGIYRATDNIWPPIVGHAAVNVLWITIVLEQF